ncbi:MAG: CoA-transferase [Betaproteobacteria bacterium RIFCSPLOWO2_12_FULL_65_14]|nr:MAG: CoA-transferase [Betaproteobacteria bacterium RIFCSPLOWO2_12_FULL_65_14]
MLGACRIVDATGRLGWLAGRLLADLGARVVKIEPPGADVSSPQWRALNVNKRLVRLPLDAQSVDQLASDCDILIATPEPGTGETALFDYPRLASKNPALVLVVLTPFGLTGPKAGWRATDLEIMAAAGAMSLAGEPDGMPVRVSAPQAYAWTGAQAAVGALVALAHCRATGRGQLVDVSAQAAVIISLGHAPPFVDIAGVSPTRAGAFMTGRSVAGARFRVFWPCRDGYVNFILYGGAAGRRTNEQLVAWMRERAVDLGPLAGQDWAQWDPTIATQEKVDALEASIMRFFSALTKREFLEGAHQREMLGYPVSTVADIAADPQLAVRGFWQDLGRERHCGVFAVIDGKRPALLEPR